MEPDPEADPTITMLLGQMSAGNAEAAHVVWTQLHDELRRRARATLRGQNAGMTLQATELIGHAYERIERLRGKAWNNREHFLAVAALSMHSALVDHVRRRHGRPQPHPLDGVVATVESRVGDLVRFEEALLKFDRIDEQLGKALRLRCLGYTVEEIASMLAISRRSLERDLQRARGMVHRLLG